MLISERSHEAEQPPAIASNSGHELQNSISEASGRGNESKHFSVASNKGYFSQDTSPVTGEILEETFATSSLSLAVSKTSVASLVEKAPESFDKGHVSEALVASNKYQLAEVAMASNKHQLAEVPIASNKDQLAEVPMASNKGQQVEVPMVSNKGQLVEVPVASNKGQLVDVPVASDKGPLVEVPVASPRIKKRARKEQLLQQHKLFGKTVLDRISKAAGLSYCSKMIFIG
jgi:hypothetical protein